MFWYRLDEQCQFSYILLCVVLIFYMFNFSGLLYFQNFWIILSGRYLDAKIYKEMITILNVIMHVSTTILYTFIYKFLYGSLIRVTLITI